MKENLVIPEIGLSTENTISSLQYARHIQDAILCNREGLIDLFRDLAIVYQPKNILSGDFYFYKKKKDSLYLAVCDCTGHGIAGALLTILGHNMLNRSLKKFDNLPDIFKYLNQKIMDSFHDDHLAIGMDMIMIKINQITNTLEFCGAKRPLWLQRNGGIQVYKTDKNSIGDDSNFNWTSQHIQLEERDRIFLFSDGYTDQFDEKDTKKFGSRKLEEILNSNHILNLTKIGNILNMTIDQYRGSQIQTDDMLILGIEV